MQGGWRDRPWLAALGLFGLAALAFLALHNLTAYPVIWFDEGAHLLLPKNLVRVGEYRGYAGPTVGVGPTVMLPIAAAFYAFGVGLLQARLVMVGFLFAAVFAHYRLARRLGGWRLALLATVLLASARGVSLFEYGRQVLGEVPAYAFLAGGLSVWFGAWERGGWRRLGLAGVLLGLAVVTKPQFAIALVPGLAVAWLVALRRLPLRLLVLPGFAAALACAAWGAFLLFGLHSTPPQEFVGAVRVLADSSALISSPERCLQALRTTFGPRMYLGLLVPALVYAVVCARRGGRNEAEWVVITAIVLANLTWFVLASVGWPRYAFVAAALGGLWVARSFEDGAAWLRARAAGRALRTAPFLLLGAVIVVPMVRPVRDVISPPPDASLAMAAYLDAHVPRDALIETWEPEMAFRTDHRYHLPLPRLQAAVVNHMWLGGPPVRHEYDALAQNADYILIGDYGHLSGAYPSKRLQRRYETVTWVARYHLLRRARRGPRAAAPE